MLAYVMENTNKIIPLFDRVLLRPMEERQSAAGVYIPRDSTERSRIMTVLQTGPEVKAVAAGDKVIVAKYAGTEVSIGADKAYIVTECDILAVQA